VAYEQKDNSGALFRNERKEKDTQPDYTGNGMVNGAEVRIAAWIKQGAKGKFMSLKFDEPRERQEPTRGGGGETAPDLDDEIPFISPWGIK
jgi:uncharacterized protein (DUF736 family)